MRESAIEKALIQAVQQAGGVCWKWVSPGINGVPDRTIVLPGGRVAFVETKTPQGKLTAIQKHRHKQLAKLDAPLYTIYHPNQIPPLIHHLTQGQPE